MAQEQSTNLFVSQINKMLQDGIFKFTTVEDGEALATFISQGCNESNFVELAINELVINAITYSLGIKSPIDTVLFSRTPWKQEIEKKSKLKNNEVVLQFKRLSESRLEISVIDKGPGFNLAKFFRDQAGKDHKLDTHGRGIELIKKLFPDFDAEILYDAGNQPIGTRCHFSVTTNQPLPTNQKATKFNINNKK